MKLEQTIFTIMNTLLLSATYLEIKPILEQFGLKSGEFFFPLTENCACLVTGIGAVQTAISVTKHLSNHTYDQIIQVGLAGSYDYTFPLGSLVEVTADKYGDLGVEEKDGTFLSIPQIGLTISSQFKNEQLTWNAFFSDELQSVSSMTVNLVAGTKETISKRAKQNVTLETMEGVSAALAAKEFEIPFTQVRAISNYVEPRNKANWNISLALEQINQFITTKIILK